MADSRLVVDLNGVSFRYGNEKKVLDNVSFQLREGDKIGLIGDNGSGKTTLLHLIVGLIKSQRGDISIFERPVATEADFFEVRKKIGILFQNTDDQLFCPTVLEDVAFGPLNLGYSADEAKEIAHATLQRLGLHGFEHRITHELSGGEKRIVALATILSMHPRVLLLDEPTSGLDDSTKHRLKEILADLDLSYIIVSHEYDFLAQSTCKIFGLKGGSIRFHGDATTLHSHFHTHLGGQVSHRHARCNMAP